jgi:putative ABC transport system permease protein
MLYALQTVWFEKRRYFAGVLAVAFSALLIAMQVGLLLGLIGVVTVPIENSSADVWVMFPGTPACDLGRPIPRYWIDRLWARKEVRRADEYIQNFAYWKTAAGSTELILLLGTGIDDNSLGPIAQLSREQRAALTEPGAVILDQRDAKRVGVTRVGQEGEINGQRVRCVGFVQDMGSLAGPYVLASIPTARSLLRFRGDQTTYLLAKCDSKEDARRLVDDLNATTRLTARLTDEFVVTSKTHWITKTKAGLALGFAAVLGLAVGASITSQTLYAAISASLRELAVLRALGIPRWRMSLFVMQQAGIVGLLGLAVGFPSAFGLVQLARQLGAKAVLPDWLLIMTTVVTLTMALFSGLVSLRSLRGVEPAALLR